MDFNLRQNPFFPEGAVGPTSARKVQQSSFIQMHEPDVPVTPSRNGGKPPIESPYDGIIGNAA